MINVRSIHEKIKKNKFGRNIALIAGGTALAQAMTILFSPIITRIYPPEQYGILTAYTAILGLLAASASLDYQKAIPIAEDDSKAINLLVLSVAILCTVVAIIAILLAIIGDAFLKAFDSQILNSYKFLIPIGVLFTGGYNIVLQWGFRKRNYKSITKTKINQSMASNLIKILLGLGKVGPVGLIFGAIIGQSAGITTLSLPFLKENELLRKIRFVDVKRVMKRYKTFPLYSAPSNYVYNAANQLPIVFMMSIFGSFVVGLFGLANSIVRLPMTLIGMSVSQVFYSEAANIGKSNPEKLKSLAIKITKKMAIIGLIPLGVLAVFGPWLFSFVFGNHWYEAGMYARIISFMVYFNFVITPVGRILEIFERQKEGLILNVVRLGLVFLVFMISKFMKLGPYNAIALYTLSNSITYVALLIIVIQVMNSEIKSN